MFERAKDDGELLQASLGGSPKAFGVLVSRYQSLVCAITYSATGSIERSEELAQEVFLRAWRSLGQLQDLSKFRAWLCSIARSTALNWFRDRSRDVVGRAAPLESAAEKASDESGPEEAAMIAEQRAVVSQALQEIPEPLREPLVLFYREQKSIREVAEQFGLSENAARQRISRGRKLLRRQVAHVVETTLERSRPGKVFTAAVIGCIAGTAVKSSAAVAVVGAAHAASAAGKSAGIASLLSGASGKMAALAAGLALITGGLFAYRQYTRAAVPLELAVAAVPYSQDSVAADYPGLETKEAVAAATPVAHKLFPTGTTPAPAARTPRTLGSRCEHETSSTPTVTQIIRVTDEFGRTPAGVRVWLTGPAGTIEAPYRAQIGLCVAALPASGCTLHATAPGYRTAQQKVAIPPYEENSPRQCVTVCLEPRRIPEAV